MLRSLVGSEMCIRDSSCTGHGRRSAPHAERISFAPCDLSTGICGDAIQSFNLDPDADTEDPRAIWVDPWYYLFYYRFPVATGSKCVGEQCTVQLSRTVTPLVPGSWERIATLPWHRNGCCLVRPGGRSWCMWGEGPSPFPGLGISYTDDFGVGEFHPTTWKLGVDNSSSPISEDGMWLLPFGPEQEEIKLEAGTHMHELSSGAVVTFYAAATPGWVPNGNYTVGWLILDGEDPTRILQRSQQHLLVPTFDYETLCPGQPNCTYSGERHNVIFLSSATPMDGYQDRFRLFFGGGDGNVGTAVVQVTLN
eukprot:TRINITY_DN62677_c0_g1_i1.p1 TRINITY_DN62677_c0_g1~~TRINITY_DN62677_c0_g1_i1.p1  ORF type:complete len:308 (+),score=51.27 TRINITY_DN62677_c0_g1_i1:91-1014(+)